MQYCGKRTRFNRLAWAYGWTDSEIAEMEVDLADRPEEARRLWRNLAVAMDAGYQQVKVGSPISLRMWCIERDWPDPHTSDFSSKAFHEAAGIAKFYRKQAFK